MITHLIVKVIITIHYHMFLFSYCTSSTSILYLFAMNIFLKPRTFSCMTIQNIASVINRHSDFVFHVLEASRFIFVVIKVERKPTQVNKTYHHHRLFFSSIQCRCHNKNWSLTNECCVFKHQRSNVPL